MRAGGANGGSGRFAQVREKVNAPNRRLAAILAADVVGYSRLMGQDEEGTHRRIKGLRSDIIEPPLSRHAGRLVKTTGDGFLIEFGSVVNAFRYASEVQDALRASEPTDSANALLLRIGINVGDVIADDDGDLFGDGVNVAARIEQICPPGGICVSERAWRDLRQQPVQFTDLGPQVLKNISDPVRAYVKMPEGQLASLPTPQTEKVNRTRLRRTSAFVLIATVLFLFACLATYLLRKASVPRDSAGVTVAIESSGVVDAGMEPLAQSSVEAIRAAFRTIPNVVVARANEATNTDVDYALIVSTQRAGEKIRFNFQITNARSGSEIFRRTIDRTASERHRIPNQLSFLTRREVGCLLLAPTVSATPIPDRALSLYANICSDSLDNTLGKVRLLEYARQITKIAPRFGIGWSARGYYAASLAREGHVGSREQLTDEATMAIAKAEQINPDNSEIYLARERLVPRENRDKREELFRKALSSTLAYGGYEYIQYGAFLDDVGRYEQAAEQFQAAYDLSPMDPYVGPLLIDALKKAGQLERAETMRESLWAVWPNEPGVWATGKQVD